jgi:hypothetical protein
MNLFILTESDGSPIADKTAAAVTSMTNTTEVSSLGNVVLGDSEPLTVKFTTGTAAPAFAGAVGYTLAVALGYTTSNGSEAYVEATGIASTTGGWTGRLPLTGTDFISAVNIAGGSSRCSQNSSTRGGTFTLHIRVTDTNANVTTYAILPVFVIWRVL